MSRNALFPNGHFYSPVVDPDTLLSQEARIWPARPQIPGVDFNDASHLHILRELFPRFIAEFDYPEHAPAADEELDRFYVQNSQFTWLDPRTLFVLMRAWRPRRIIEVGSGYSSLLMADVNLRYLDGTCEVICVEPYPRPFLRRGIPGLSQVIEKKVEDVPLDLFARLESGDLLFIDSSHVAKTGSDVNYLFFEVLPRLKPGVRIHVHDIFLPLEYPRGWVIDDNRCWNEQYVVRALMMYSSGFRILFGTSYAFHQFPDEVIRALALPSGAGFGGGSLWIERIGAPQRSPFVRWLAGVPVLGPLLRRWRRWMLGLFK